MKDKIFIAIPAFMIGILLAIATHHWWLSWWPTPGGPVIGPAITHTTYERSSGTVSMTDANASIHTYSYSDDANAQAAYLTASQPAATWSNNSVTFVLATETAVATPLNSSNLQLVSLLKAGQKYNVVFEPFGSTQSGDEVTYVFDNTKEVDAKTLALALKHAESAPTRLTLTQAASDAKLSLSFSLQ